MIKAIIFDAYGTLFDTGDASVRASKRILDKNGRNIDAEYFYQRWKELHRKNIDSLLSFVKEQDIFLTDLEQLNIEFGIEGDPKEDVKIMLDTLGRRSTYSDTTEVLDELGSKYKLYVASTSDHAPLFTDIRRNQIKVDRFFTSESLGLYKPRKEFYLKILAEIKMSPNEVVFVGDSLIDDVSGPASVGIVSVWLNRKNRIVNDELNLAYQISDLYQLLDLDVLR